MADANVWTSRDARLGAVLAAYISVLIVGILEDCIEHLILVRVGKAGDNQIMNYVGKVLKDRFRNPDYGSISGLLGQFSEEYQRKFKGRIPPGGREGTALDSITENKNSLAHVGTWKYQMTVGDVEEYYRRIVPILGVMEEILT